MSGRYVRTRYTVGWPAPLPLRPDTSPSANTSIDGRFPREAIVDTFANNIPVHITPGRGSPYPSPVLNGPFTYTAAGLPKMPTCSSVSKRCELPCLRRLSNPPTTRTCSRASTTFVAEESHRGQPHQRVSYHQSRLAPRLSPLPLRTHDFVASLMHARVVARPPCRATMSTCSWRRQGRTHNRNWNLVPHPDPTPTQSSA